MKQGRVVNAETETVICECCDIADNFWTRGRGLLGRDALDENEGIWLLPGNSIHMFGMKFPIDVVFLTKEMVVADFVENIAPGKTYVAREQGGGKPHSALELPAGRIACCGLKIGDALRLDEMESKS